MCWIFLYRFPSAYVYLEFCQQLYAQEVNTVQKTAFKLLIRVSQRSTSKSYGHRVGDPRDLSRRHRMPIRLFVSYAPHRLPLGEGFHRRLELTMPKSHLRTNSEVHLCDVITIEDMSLEVSFHCSLHHQQQPSFVHFVCSLHQTAGSRPRGGAPGVLEGVGWGSVVLHDFIYPTIPGKT